MGDTPEEIARDVAAIGRISAVPVLLRVICQTTAMRFAAVARVTDKTWTACAVEDNIAFGLKPGEQLELTTTLCLESMQARAPVVFDHASQDPVYCGHHTPRIYGIESYISVPIVLPGGEYFGNLCAIDPAPAQPSRPHIVSQFQLFSELIAIQLGKERWMEQQATELSDALSVGALREQFVAVLGHDLRGPLSAISVASTLLKVASTRPDVVLDVAGRIERSTRRMAELIDNVMDFARARLGSGIGTVIAETSDLGRAIEDVMSELATAHPDRRLDSKVEIFGTVRCDRGRIQQVVSNLAANALAHGAPDAPVIVTARTEGRAVVIRVANSGKPIPPDQLAMVFTPFWRRSASGDREGLGLGLYICAQIVKAHAGTLEVQSSAEQGTAFTVRLPI